MVERVIDRHRYLASYLLHELDVFRRIRILMDRAEMQAPQIALGGEQRKYANRLDAVSPEQFAQGRNEQPARWNVRHIIWLPFFERQSRGGLLKRNRPRGGPRERAVGCQ